MRPITLTHPKPPVKVLRTSMIETVIAGLERRGVKKIYVVVGCLKEAFKDLLSMYPHLELAENTELTVRNDISSIHAVAHLMGKEDCFICEADLNVSDPSIFDAQMDHSGYYGKMVKGHSDDWVFDLDDNGQITCIGKYGDDAYNMCGICYLKQKKAKVVADAIQEAYNHSSHEDLFLDQIEEQQPPNLDLMVHPVNQDQIVEIESAAELKASDPSCAHDED